MSSQGGSLFSHFKGSLLLTVVGLGGAYAIGHVMTGTFTGGLSSVFICFVLSILEISLSFDNAIVNASVLGRMTPLWRHRFLTWGILIAVFGMRLVFPLGIVSIMTSLNPWQALLLAIGQPEQYAAYMQRAHIPVSAFGGAFLLMVALKHFFDSEREVFWITWIEKPLALLGRLRSSELAIAMLALYGISRALPPDEVVTFLIAGLFGLITFIAVDGLSSLLEISDATKKTDQKAKPAHHKLHRASVGLFVYLEVLDASFSFDGVVGAFAITTNLILITIGLGIGALFVRSLTILLVDRGTLREFRYLEHGAFWAIGALAVIMFINTFHEVNEIVTGTIGAALIALSLYSSIRHNRRHPEVTELQQ